MFYIDDYRYGYYSEIIRWIFVDRVAVKKCWGVMHHGKLLQFHRASP